MSTQKILECLALLKAGCGFPSVAGIGLLSLLYTGCIIFSVEFARVFDDEYLFDSRKTQFWPGYLFSITLIPAITYIGISFRISHATLDGIFGHMVMGACIFSVMLFYFTLYTFDAMLIATRRAFHSEVYYGIFFIISLCLFYSALLAICIAAAAKYSVHFNSGGSRYSAYIYGTAMGVSLAIGFSMFPLALAYTLEKIFISYAICMYATAFIATFGLFTSLCSFNMVSFATAKFPGTRTEEQANRWASLPKMFIINFGVVILTVFIVFSLILLIAVIYGDFSMGVSIFSTVFTILFGMVTTIGWYILGDRCRREIADAKSRDQIHTLAQEMVHQKYDHIGDAEL